MSATSTPTATNPAIAAGQNWRALPREVTSPEGISWDYPFGEGIATVLAVSAPGETTEWGTRNWEAVWYRFRGTTSVAAVGSSYFSKYFHRI